MKNIQKNENLEEVNGGAVAIPGSGDLCSENPALATCSGWSVG